MKAKKGAGVAEVISSDDGHDPTPGTTAIHSLAYTLETHGYRALYKETCSKIIILPFSPDIMVVMRALPWTEHSRTTIEDATTKP